MNQPDQPGLAVRDEAPSRCDHDAGTDESSAKKFANLLLSPVKCNAGGNLPLGTVLAAIRGGKYKDAIDHYRCVYDEEREAAIAAGDAPEVRASKARVAAETFGLHGELPIFTLPGNDGSSRATNAALDSTLVFIHFDDTGDYPKEIVQLTKQRARSIPYLVAVFLSRCGYGLTFLVAVPNEPARYAHWERQALQLMLREVHWAAEATAKHVDGFCPASYDPDLFFNDNAIPLAEQLPVSSPKHRAGSRRKGNAQEYLGGKEEGSAGAKDSDTDNTGDAPMGKSGLPLGGGCPGPEKQGATISTLGLPNFVLDLLNSCPTAGAGVHSWLFRAARVLHAYRTLDQIPTMLAAACADCGRVIPDKEIMDAVENSRAVAWQPGQHAPSSASRPGQPNTTARRPAAGWPTRNYEQIEAIVSEGRGVADLWETSAMRIETNDPQTEALIDVLFPGDPCLCCGKSVWEFDTKSREAWRGTLHMLSFIVPSPMTGIYGTTKDGRPSKHTLDNTGPRRFLVVEFDFKEKDDKGHDTADAPLVRFARERGMDVRDICAALLLHLATKAPLTMAVHSGGKSIHGWFYCAGRPEDKLLKFMRYAVLLGADHATWTRSQFVRMPDGARDNGHRQSALFFNPSTIKI